MVDGIERVATKGLLTKENYKLWLQEIDLLLSINGVDDYIYEEKIKYIDKRKIKKEDISKHKKVKRRENLYNDIIVTEDMVRADITAKYYLHNSISDDIKVKINFQSISAYQNNESYRKHEH